MSQKSPEIGQCQICLSNLNISNIYAISKCGHTFHQKCIHHWISSANNCPTCHTNAFQSDIIKLFIQENNVEIKKKEEILPYIEIKFNNWNNNCCRRIMKECKCEIDRYETGNLKYKCLKDFDVKIDYYKFSGIIHIAFPDEIIVDTYKSTLSIIRGKTNEKSIVNPSGKRLEYGMRNGRKKYFYTTERTFRSNEDIVEQDKNRIKFCFPKFTIKRSLKNGENEKVTIYVYTNDPNKSLKIQICSEHQSFFVEHLFEKKINRCTNSEFLCDHLRE